MTITVPITAIGIVRASEALLAARNDLAQRHDNTTKIVSVEVERNAGIATSELPSQKRAVDLQV